MGMKGARHVSMHWTRLATTVFILGNWNSIYLKEAWFSFPAHLS